MNTHADIVIIGSGMAGYMLAQNIRQIESSKSITVVTQNDGRFYPKPMLSTALYHKKSPDHIVTATAQEMMDKYNIHVMTNAPVTEVDFAQKKVQLPNQSLAYDQLVFATGSKSNKIPKVKDIEGLLSVNSIEDYETLLDQLPHAQEILIIGSGLVGIEFSHDLLTAGHRVSMVSQTEEALLGLVPKTIGLKCRDHLIGMGLEWITDAGVRDVQRQDKKLSVHFSEQPTKQYDLVLSAIGIAPNTDLAKQSGLNTKRGIITDTYGCCRAKDVFALGDCAEIYGLNLTYVAPIKQQAQAIAKTLTGTKTPVHYPAMPVVVKMPTFPLTLVPVREPKITGQWEIQDNADDSGMIAAFYDEKKLKGFALAGTATRQRNEWLAKMPDSIVSEGQSAP